MSIPLLSVFSLMDWWLNILKRDIERFQDGIELALASGTFFLERFYLFGENFELLILMSDNSSKFGISIVVDFAGEFDSFGLRERY